MNIGKSLRMAMVHRDMTQQQVSELAEITRTYVSNICRGRAKVSQDLLERLAKATDYSVSEFIALGE